MGDIPSVLSGPGILDPQFVNKILPVVDYRNENLGLYQFRNYPGLAWGDWGGLDFSHINTVCSDKNVVTFILIGSVSMPFICGEAIHGFGMSIVLGISPLSEGDLRGAVEVEKWIIAQEGSKSL